MGTDKIIPESELILNPDGSVYHLNIRPEHLAGKIILVGDPGRVEMVSAHFDSIDFRSSHREFVIHTGFYRSTRITVMSTGMGTDNIDIVMNELDALVNIDLETRMIKQEHSRLDLFRLGTSGSLQPDLPLNAAVVSEYGIGLDGMLGYYRFEEEPDLADLKDAFLEHTGWDPGLPTPYMVEADPRLLNLLESPDVHRGITVTAPGFYGPQGRVLRLPLAYPGINDRLQTFRHGSLRILNYEMETSALYGLGRMLGHRTITVCLSVANRKIRAMNRDYDASMNRLIDWLLEKVDELND